jgi:hypothetical protein
MDQKTRSFIGASFRSVWSLELLIQLRGEPERAFQESELVALLRASDAVVARGKDELLAAGLIVEEADGGVRYAPGSAELARCVDDAVALYRSKPDAVRRLIVVGASRDLAAFADAFRLKGDRG